MDGEPLENVMVTFMPEGGGRSSTGMTDASGSYELVYVGEKGAEIGKHKISVKSVPKVEGGDEEMTSDSSSYESQAMGDPSAYDDATVTEAIPARYNTETTLVEEVTAGSNVIDLELTSS